MEYGRVGSTCCHSLTLMSALAVTSDRPLLSQAMPLMLSECAPMTSAKPTPVIASHTFMLPSRPPVASIVPADMYIRLNTAVWRVLTRKSDKPDARRLKNWPRAYTKTNATRGAPVSAFQTTAKESWSPLAMVRLQLLLGNELLAIPGPQQQQHTAFSCDKTRGQLPVVTSQTRT